MTAIIDFTVIRGNKDTLQVGITDADGAVANITGAEITFAAKRHPDFAMHLIRKTVGDGISITDGPAGKAEIVIDPADTMSLPANVDLYYDIRTVKDGDTDVPIKGRLTVEADVSR